MINLLHDCIDKFRHFIKYNKKFLQKINFMSLQLHGNIVGVIYSFIKV